MTVVLFASQSTVGKEGEIMKKKFISVPVSDKFPPDYTLPAGADPALIREMAVRAMDNELSVPWTPAETYRYRKEGYCTYKEYVFEKDTLYGGIPYSDAGYSLFQFLRFYDPETGVVTLPDKENVNHTIGCMCGESVMWALASVCPEICGEFMSGFMTRYQGLYPVCGWDCDPKLDAYTKYSTVQICRDYGEDFMLECYTKILRGYILCCSANAGNTNNHAVMAVTDAVVERLPNGKINPKLSYVVVQEQRSGTKYGGIATLCDGKMMEFMGKTDTIFTFAHLWEKGFVPLATAEMAGLKPYVPAKVTLEKEEGGSLETLLAGQVVSNYILCTVTLTLTSGRKTVFKETIGISKFDVISGKAWRVPLSDFKPKLEPGSYRAVLEALPATGRRFTLFKGAVTV